MYLYLLEPRNDEFAQGVKQQQPPLKSKQAGQVVKAVQEARNGIDKKKLFTLLKALQEWRMQEPPEFNAFNKVAGLGYRIWMEAKQLLRNRYKEWYPFGDPTRPASPLCTEVCGVHVPPTGKGELCHSFTYRWAISAGKLTEQQGIPAYWTQGFSHDGILMEPILFPGGYFKHPSVRENSEMKVQSGDIIGMFEVHNDEVAKLQHSVIALTRTKWFGSNNLGMFGIVGNRVEVDTSTHYVHLVSGGWEGDDNVWKRPDGASVRVVYRRL